MAVCSWGGAGREGNLSAVQLRSQESDNMYDFLSMIQFFVLLTTSTFKPSVENVGTTELMQTFILVQSSFPGCCS